MHRTLIALILCTATQAAAQQAAPAPAQPSAQAQAAPASPTTTTPSFIQHEPLNQIEQGPAELVFEVRDPDRAGTIVARVLPDGFRPMSEPTSLRAFRTERGYIVAIAAQLITEPGFSYWVVERAADGRERALFASQAAPHHVRVTLSPQDESERERIHLRDGRRSSMIAAAEWVDFGKRHLVANGPALPDSYYRLEAGYGYAFLRTVEDVQLTVVRMRGDAGTVLQQPDPGQGLAGESGPLGPGIDYGRAQVTLLLADGVRLRGSTLLGASQKGFEYGGGGALVLGDPEGSSFTLGGEGISTLGASASMRLGFALTPALPMGAAIELTDFPLGDDAGVRLLYDVGYAFSPASVFTIRAGFQGRTNVTGGVSVGATLHYGF